MTVLGAVVFGGLLALGVLWLLMTAPDSEVDFAWDQLQWHEQAPLSASGATSSTH
jgi:hypothetical protein